MNNYSPNRWIIVGYNNHFKVLGGWSGGYLDGDSWRLSSGLQKIEEDGDYYLMHNYSGSVYKCHKEAEGVNIASSGILSKIEKLGGRRYSVEEFNSIKDSSDGGSDDSSN
jgi:hypothetical protein